jgi:hypothetical protein
VVWSNEGVLGMLVLLFVDSLVGKLALDAFEALSSVRLCALRLGEEFQSLGLAAHGALDLDLLLTGALVAVDGLVHLANVYDLPARVGELFDGELGLWEVLHAPAALHLHREWDALQPVSRLPECILDRAAETASCEPGTTLRLLGL